MAAVIGKTGMTAVLSTFLREKRWQWYSGFAHGKIMAVALNEKRRGGEEEKLKDLNVKKAEQ